VRRNYAETLVAGDFMASMHEHVSLMT
jgi:hypothetical protein